MSRKEQDKEGRKQLKDEKKKRKKKTKRANQGERVREDYLGDNSVINTEELKRRA